MNLFRLLVWLGILPHPVVKCGTSRIVWIFPRFAVKFPLIQIKMFFRIIWSQRRTYKGLRRIFLVKSRQFPYTFHGLVTVGLLDNWGEFTFFMKNRKDPFLFPTIFSLFGLFTITPIGEDVPTKLLYRQKFEPYLPHGFAKDDEHHFFASRNFCKYRGRVCMRDYGSPITQQIISKHKEAFNRFSLEVDLS